MPGLLGSIEQYGKGFLDKWAPRNVQVGPYAPPIDRELAAKQANVDQYLQAYPATGAPAPAAHPGIIEDLLKYIPRLRAPKQSSTRFDVEDQVPRG